jgi:hypothetical protein
MPAGTINPYICVNDRYNLRATRQLENRPNCEHRYRSKDSSIVGEGCAFSLLLSCERHFEDDSRKDALSKPVFYTYHSFILVCHKS